MYKLNYNKDIAGMTTIPLQGNVIKIEKRKERR
jgi:hypothetical protein